MYIPVRIRQPLTVVSLYKINVLLIVEVQRWLDTEYELVAQEKGNKDIIIIYLQCVFENFSCNIATLGNCMYKGLRGWGEGGLNHLKHCETHIYFLIACGILTHIDIKHNPFLLPAPHKIYLCNLAALLFWGALVLGNRR